MAKKQQADENYDNDSDMNTDGPGMGDFDVEEEYAPPPLIAEGYYNGAVTNVRFNAEDATIEWEVTLSENGGVMSDGNTPIDGSIHVYKNWLPKGDDDVALTKKGTQTKRQAKINMLHDFAEGMKVTMSTPTVILDHIANSDWIGMSVQAKLEIRTWDGRNFNSINRMVAS